MKYWNNRFSRNLAALLLFAVLFVAIAVPMPVQAASFQMNWYDGSTETTISVEAGNKFYIGDYAMILYGTTSSTASLVKASYQSTVKKVASVNGKGYLNAKKAGTTDIKISYKGKKIICHLTVEKKGAFGLKKNVAVNKLKSAAKTLAKGLPGKLSAAKGFSLKKKIDKFLVQYNSYSLKKLSYDGFLYEKDRPAPSTVAEYDRSEKLAVPEAGRYLTAESLLRQFKQKNDPTSKKSSKTMQIASASASSKSNRITIKLKKKIDANQILAAQLAYPKDNSTINSKTKANLMMTIYDRTAGKYYKGELTLKKGSKQFTVKPVVYTYGKYESVNLVKGHVYQLESTLTWANGKKVTAK